MSKSALKGFIAGALGGVIATVAMDIFQKLSLESTRSLEDAVGAEQIFTKQQEDQLKSFEHAHADTAGTLAAGAGKSLSRSDKKAAAPLVHYAFGALCGGVYGAVVEYWEPAAYGSGSVFGTSIFLAASEVILPALGLMPAPGKTPPLLHAGGLTAHAIYGSGTEAVRSVIRKAL